MDERDKIRDLRIQARFFKDKAANKEVSLLARTSAAMRVEELLREIQQIEANVSNMAYPLYTSGGAASVSKLVMNSVLSANGPITWQCEACGKTIPDSEITVTTSTVMDRSGLSAHRNFTHCKDKAACIAQARKVCEDFSQATQATFKKQDYSL